MARDREALEPANKETPSRYRRSLATALGSIELAAVWDFVWVLQQIRGGEIHCPGAGVIEGMVRPVREVDGQRYVFWPLRQVRKDMAGMEGLSDDALRSRLGVLMSKGLLLRAPAEAKLPGERNDGRCWYHADRPALDRLCPRWAITPVADQGSLFGPVPPPPATPAQGRENAALDSPISSRATPQKCGLARARPGATPDPTLDSTPRKCGVDNKEVEVIGDLEREGEVKPARARAGGRGFGQLGEAEDSAGGGVAVAADPTADAAVAALRDTLSMSQKAAEAELTAADPHRVLVACANARKLGKLGYPFTSFRGWVLKTIRNGKPLSELSDEEAREKTEAAHARDAARKPSIEERFARCGDEIRSAPTTPPRADHDAIVEHLVSSSVRFDRRWAEHIVRQSGCSLERAELAVRETEARARRSDLAPLRDRRVYCRDLIFNGDLPDAGAAALDRLTRGKPEHVQEEIAASTCTIATRDASARRWSKQLELVIESLSPDVLQRAVDATVARGSDSKTYWLAKPSHRDPRNRDAHTFRRALWEHLQREGMAHAESVSVSRANQHAAERRP